MNDIRATDRVDESQRESKLHLLQWMHTPFNTSRAKKVEDKNRRAKIEFQQCLKTRKTCLSCGGFLL